MNSEPEETLYHFDTAYPPGSEQVGGKAAALIEMTHARLPVPSGFVLSTTFFRPWLQRLQATPEWDAFTRAVGAENPDDEELRHRTANLAASCVGLTLTERQQLQLDSGLRRLSCVSSGLFAVRSSAPQEDLTGASFAGVYESVLAVPSERIVEAVRTVFLSGLDFRAVSYKLRSGFDPTRVEIAVIVQRQPEVTSAGVAFSVNPVTNDYDEAVIQANRGLGETVVAGRVSPDEVTVDKHRQRVVATRTGARETALWSEPDGEVVEKPSDDGDDSRSRVLTAEQAVEITRMLLRVETLISVPVDIEWAYATDGALSLLQARPVTTYFPLPEELCTEPGGSRRLYMDSTLLEEGLQEPLSVLGEAWMEDAISAMIREATMRSVTTRDGDGLVLTVGGRWYANVSNMLWVGSERLARSVETLDVHAARVLRGIDARRYRQAARKRSGVGSVARTVLGTIACSAGPLGRMLRALARPEHARRHYAAAVARHHQHLAEVTHAAGSVPELGKRTVRQAVALLMREGLPLTYAAEAATSLIRLLYRGAGSESRQYLDAALSSMPHNITVEMGLDLYDLARSLEQQVGEEAYTDLSALARRVEAREPPEPFLRQWDEFLHNYGFRGPNELDLAAPRYADDPLLVLEQMRQYAQLDESTQEDPRQAHERRQRSRREAYRELLDRTRNPVKKWVVRRLYRTAEEFTGYREIHKYQLVRAGDRVRRRALELGRALVEEDRIDSVEQIFELTYDDLSGESGEPGRDLRTRARDNTGYRRLIRRMPGVRFPVLVDSRGYIPRPPSGTGEPGVLIGEGVSTGRTSGPAKVLRHVGEKPVLPGEVLVARASDPGWTPLFVHAAGVVLETGGSFQHGALVAREYGKPCLVGIEDATQRIADGQMVEVDGAAGTLTIVSESTG